MCYTFADFPVGTMSPVKGTSLPSLRLRKCLAEGRFFSSSSLLVRTLRKESCWSRARSGVHAGATLRKLRSSQKLRKYSLCGQVTFSSVLECDDSVIACDNGAVALHRKQLLIPTQTTFVRFAPENAHKGLHYICLWEYGALCPGPPEPPAATIVMCA